MAVNTGTIEPSRREDEAGPAGASRRPVRRAARVAYTFVLMNYTVVEALVRVCLGRQVWR